MSEPSEPKKPRPKLDNRHSPPLKKLRVAKPRPPVSRGFLPGGWSTIVVGAVLGLLVLILGWDLFAGQNPDAATNRATKGLGPATTAPQVDDIQWSTTTLVLAKATTLEKITLEDYKKLIGDLKGHPVMVNFWASWCGPCRREAPLLQDYHERYGDIINIIGVAVDDGEGPAQAFIDEFSLTYPNYFDHTGEIDRVHRIFALPTSIFYDSDGSIANIVPGALFENDLDRELENIAPGFKRE